MAFRNAVHRLTASVDVLDREQLSGFCEEHGFTPIRALEARTRVVTGGEVRSVRIVPRAGAAALEVTISDGTASVTAVFLGRRKISGMTPGRRLSLEGMVARDGKQLLVYNPDYTFLA